MRDRLKKYRKEDQAEKRFGKDISVSTMDETPMRKTPDTIDVKGPSRLRESKPAAGGSFSSAFAAARKAGDKTFTWKGKSFTTEMAGEKKAAPARSAPAKAPASTPAKIPAPAKAIADRAAGYREAFQGRDGVAKFTKETPKPKAAKPESPWAKDASGGYKDNSAAARRTRLGDALSLGTTAVIRNWGSEDRAKGGAIKKYAKGGSIDGCAVRGKTKAMRKK
jgi:hypothetical protein